MTDVLIRGSSFNPKPHFHTFNVVDSTAKGNAIRQIEEKRRLRHMKFPSLGRHDVDSFQKNVNLNAFKKWNDDGEYRSPAPSRAYDNIIDPASGFVSAGADLERETSKTSVRPLVEINKTPQSATPKHIDSIRKDFHAPPELRRESTWAPGAPYKWNSRKISDGYIRAKLGGWTSDVDPRTISESKRPQTSPEQQNRTSRDKLALKYVYSTSTQRAYEEVPWDDMLLPRPWPPVSTLEENADAVTPALQVLPPGIPMKILMPVKANIDRWQTRKTYFKWKDQPITFSTPCVRRDQIPLYSGCIGAENLEEIDNAQEHFSPFTIKRVAIPRISETSHRPNIPLYTGCTKWQDNYSPANSSPQPEGYRTTNQSTYRPIPTETVLEAKRDSKISKVVTLVPPCNPFVGPEKET